MCCCDAERHSNTCTGVHFSAVGAHGHQLTAPQLLVPLCTAYRAPCRCCGDAQRHRISMGVELRSMSAAA